MTAFGQVTFGIPSYKRADQLTTADALVAKGVPARQIVVAVQSEEDLAAYRAAWGAKYRIIYRQGRCLSDNRNTLITSLPPHSPLVILDDDIRDFVVYCGVRRPCYRSMPPWVFRRFIETGYAFLDKFGGTGEFGFRPTNSNLNAHRRVVMDGLIEGTCIALYTSASRLFSNQFVVKEDFEFSCRNLMMGGHTFRFDDVSSNCKHFANDGTGCGAHFAKDDECTRNLCALYPEYLTPCSSKQKLRFIGKTRKFASFLGEREYLAASNETDRVRAAKNLPV